MGESAMRARAQLGCGLALWDRLQFLECRSERMGETPDRSRSEFLVPRLEVEVMDTAGEVFGSVQFALHECLVDDHLCRDVRQFTPLPCFHLLSHGLEV